MPDDKPKDAYIHTGEGGRLRLLLDKRPEQPSAPAPSRAPEEPGRLDVPRLPKQIFVVDEDTVEFLDLGTKFLGPHTPYEYAEDPDYTALFQRNPDTGVFFIASGDLAHLDTLMLQPARRATALLADNREVPNVLPLNNKNSSVNKVANLNLWDSAGHQTSVVDISVAGWKWDAVRIPAGEAWAASNTLHRQAPDTGQLFAKKSHNYVGVSLGDTRYWEWDTRGPDWKVTVAPVFTAPAAPFKVKFPMRVFGVPFLYRVFESSNASVHLFGPPPAFPLTYQKVVYVSIIETGLNFVAREPQIPAQGLPTPDAFLARFPALIHSQRVVTKTVTYVGSGFPAPPPPEITVTDVPRRLSSFSALESDATGIAVSMIPDSSAGSVVVDSAGGVAPLYASSDPAFLTTISRRQQQGHLSGIIEADGRVYYIWRAT